MFNLIHHPLQIVDEMFNLIDHPLQIVDEMFNLIGHPLQIVDEMFNLIDHPLQIAHREMQQIYLFFWDVAWHRLVGKYLLTPRVGR
jgi:hypothetical protein